MTYIPEVLLVHAVLLRWAQKGTGRSKKDTAINCKGIHSLGNGKERIKDMHAPEADCAPKLTEEKLIGWKWFGKLANQFGDFRKMFFFVGIMLLL